MHSDNGHETTGSKLRDLDREQLRSLVWPEPEADDEHNRRAYDVRLIREFGTEAGLLLSRLVYLTGKSHDPKGRVYLTKEQIREETGLSRYKVDKIRDQLEREGVLEYENDTRHVRDQETDRLRQRSSRTGHYRVKLAALAERLGLESRQPSTGGLHSRSSTAQVADPRLLKQPNVDRFHIQGVTSKDTDRGKEGPPPTFNDRKQGSQTPPEGIEALENSDDRIVKRLSPWAYRWDFTEKAPPPTAIWLPLGGDDQERERYWKRMRRIAREAVGAKQDPDLDADPPARSKSGFTQHNQTEDPNWLE